tara:strand:- start:685 stop:1398 length:714 start_codon:yes stop_codon:yes gene_type:complete
MLDPVFFFFDHLIQTKMLPRKMASETFFAKFTEYCEKEGYPTPKDMETVTKIIDSVPLSRYGFDMGYMVRVGPEIHFPDPEMLKKYLDKLVIESKCLLTEEPQLGVDLIGPKGTRSLEDIYEEIENSPLKRCSFKAKENGLCMRHQLNKKEYENDGICQANCGLIIFEREKRQARRRESYKKNSERERESSRSVVKEYDALRAEIIKRQDELDKMRSNFKSLGAKKRKLEIEEEEKM